MEGSLKLKDGGFHTGGQKLFAGKVLEGHREGAPEPYFLWQENLGKSFWGGRGRRVFWGYLVRWYKTWRYLSNHKSGGQLIGRGDAAQW